MSNVMVKVATSSWVIFGENLDIETCTSQPHTEVAGCD